MELGTTTAPVFFRPRDAWVGDVIPFEQDGQFWLYYLLERREDPPTGMPWHLVTTEDFVSFADQGLALATGEGQSAEDHNCYTGSIVRDEQGGHHLFYTAQNPKILGGDGLPLQLVAHATSAHGMATWTKHPEHTFGATPGYEASDWRDPFVFRHPDGRWHMLLATRHLTGPERRRGVIARCVSDDLVTWEAAEPFWDPRRYITHECPEVFQWGQWWYLVYSEFSDRFVTRYRMARGPEGPWEAPAHDTLDGRAWDAAKSATRDGRRFFFGWIASRADQRDDGAWQWAGSLSTLEALQREDGTLAMRPPTELLDSSVRTGPHNSASPRVCSTPPTPTRPRSPTTTLRASSTPGWSSTWRRAPASSGSWFAVPTTATPGTCCDSSPRRRAWCSTAGRVGRPATRSGRSPVTCPMSSSSSAPSTCRQAGTSSRPWSTPTSPSSPSTAR